MGEMSRARAAMTPWQLLAKRAISAVSGFAQRMNLLSNFQPRLQPGDFTLWSYNRMPYRVVVASWQKQAREARRIQTRSSVRA